jgi:hypothetical protein
LRGKPSTSNVRRLGFRRYFKSRATYGDPCISLRGYGGELIDISILTST